MICPKCKHEVMNVNGRYVCVECGSELSEDQLEYDPGTAPATPSETTVDASVESTTAEEEAPATTVQTEEVATTETSAPESVLVESTASVEEPVSSVPLPDAEAEKTISEIVTPSAEIPDVSPVQEEESPAESEVPEIPVVTAEPETVGPVSTDVPAEPTLDTLEGATQSEEELAVPAEPETAPVPEISEAPAEPALPEAPPAIPDTVEVPSMQEVSAPEPIMQTATPEIPTPTAPVDMFAQAAPSSVDPNIYQNPIFDQPATPESVATGKSDEELVAEKITSDNKKMYAILIAGAIVFIVFIIGGIIAYVSLTK